MGYKSYKYWGYFYIIGSVCIFFCAPELVSLWIVFIIVGAINIATSDILKAIKEK